MFFKIWETAYNYFKKRPYWAIIQPLFIFLSFYVFAVVLAYQFIEWRYQISPSVTLYLRSYIFKQITLIFIAVSFISISFKLIGKAKKEERQTKFREFIQRSSKSFLKRAVIIGLVLAIFIPILIYLSPNKVSHIYIKFLDEPDFDKYAFLYLVFELNKLQKNWYFEVDFDVFDERVLATEQRKRCTEEDKSLCYARIIAKDKALIGITAERLGDDFFWRNMDKVSVISTYRWEEYAPPSKYEYLVYSIIVQSITIHLNAQGKALPKEAFRESRSVYGDLFQFSPRRRALKADILAAHLNQEGEKLLLNCFGVEYLSICSRILTLEWFHSERILKNLKKSFNVEL